MKTNPVIDIMMNRKSIRKYQERVPDDDVVETMVKAAFQAPFAAQLGSLLLSRDAATNPFRAPLLFTVCVDVHRLERIMEARGWRMRTGDAAILLFGIQDACYVAENLVIAAESYGMGSCYLGMAPFAAEKIAERYALPARVFPVVQLAVGYPDEDPAPRPRYPLSFSLFEDRYTELSDEGTEDAMRVMDEGYLAQDYYRRANYMIELEGDREETFTYDDYGWTEHMCRKWGQWLGEPEKILGPLRARGFDVTGGPGGVDEGGPRDADADGSGGT
ncbi:MAG: nitroreductase family protein [Candidatus Eisenbacteria bacterium]